MIFPLVIIDLLFWTCRALFSMEPAAFYDAGQNERSRGSEAPLVTRKEMFPWCCSSGLSWSSFLSFSTGVGFIKRLRGKKKEPCDSTESAELSLVPTLIFPLSSMPKRVVAATSPLSFAPGPSVCLRGAASRTLTEVGKNNLNKLTQQNKWACTPEKDNPVYFCHLNIFVIDRKFAH